MELNHKIGIGTAQFGMKYGISNMKGKTPISQVTNILSLAKRRGVIYIDTASAYGNAEKVLGLCNLDGFRIVSKFMPPVDLSITDQLNKTLQDLNVPMLYGYMAHRPSVLNDDTYWVELLHLKNLGKMSKIGYSANSIDEVNFLLDEKKIPDIIQLPFNYFDNRFEDIITKLKSRGTEIHIRSVFLQGLFFADIKLLSDFFNPVKKTLQELQDNYKERLPSILLKYALSMKFIDVVIMGVEDEFQLKNNLENIGLVELINNYKECQSELILNPSNWPKK
ncbi:aldo/keto reductase [Joostella sp.]|uniref:aldo/keto reductase n=1 Tax=Joostella sp. TaxID=2231138 RepID=UPI003A8F4349